MRNEPPSESSELQNSGTYRLHNNVKDMKVVQIKNNNNSNNNNNKNNNDSFHNNNGAFSEQNNNSTASIINNGYNESSLSGSPQINTVARTLDEFDIRRLVKLARKLQ